MMKRQAHPSQIMPLSAQPAFARVSLNSALHHGAPAHRAPVRIYHGPSRFILVGNIDAVCRMLGQS